MLVNGNSESSKGQNKFSKTNKEQKVYIETLGAKFVFKNTPEICVESIKRSAVNQPESLILANHLIELSKSFNLDSYLEHLSKNSYSHNLLELNLQNIDLSDSSILEKLTSFPNLQILNLSNTQLSNEQLNLLVSLQSLKTLNLSSNSNLSDVSVLDSLKNVEFILSGTKLYQAPSIDPPRTPPEYKLRGSWKQKSISVDPHTIQHKLFQNCRDLGFNGNLEFES